jgi:hypothetical protein
MFQMFSRCTLCTGTEIRVHLEGQQSLESRTYQHRNPEQHRSLPSSILCTYEQRLHTFMCQLLLLGLCEQRLGYDLSSEIKVMVDAQLCFQRYAMLLTAGFPIMVKQETKGSDKIGCL